MVPLDKVFRVVLTVHWLNGLLVLQLLGKYFVYLLSWCRTTDIEASIRIGKGTKSTLVTSYIWLLDPLLNLAASRMSRSGVHRKDWYALDIALGVYRAKYQKCEDPWWCFPFFPIRQRLLKACTGLWYCMIANAGCFITVSIIQDAMIGWYSTSTRNIT